MVEPAKKAMTADELAKETEEELRAAKAEKEAEKAWKVYGDLEPEKPEEKKPESEPPIELATYKDRGQRFWEPPKEDPKEAPKEEPLEGKPTIELSSAGMGNAAVLAMHGLKGRGAAIYQRDGALVRPVRDPAIDASGKRTWAVSLIGIAEPFLKSQLYKHIHFQRKSKEGVLFDTGPGTEITKLILGLRGEWPFPTATGLIAAPTLRFDGSLLPKEGYDEATGLYLLNSLSVGKIPAEWADAKGAIELFRELISETAFVDLGSRSVGLSLILTTMMRGAIDVAPLHSFTSPQGGYGKSTFLDIANLIATGEVCPVVAASPDPLECEKRIAAAARTGRPIISLDNLNGTLESNFLCQLVTQLVVTYRLLHSNDEERITSRSVYSVNGNNLIIAGDLVRRTLQAMIDAKMENSTDLVFQKKPLEMIRRDRAKYVRAALTIPLWYLKSGMPDCPRDLNGFSRWSQLVRAPLMALGEADPVATMQAVREGDPKLQDAATLRVAMVDLFGLGQKLFMSEMLEAIKSDANLREILATPVDAPVKLRPKQKALRDALMAVAGDGKEISPDKLSTWLRGNRDKIVAGFRLCGEKDGHSKVLRWWIEQG
jgi:hypothetical protein